MNAPLFVQPVVLAGLLLNGLTYFVAKKRDNWQSKILGNKLRHLL
jgi:hypothetical protein